MQRILSYLLVALFLIGCQQVNPPEPVLPIPDQRQLTWQQMEFYAFVHFNMNTFTNMEWGNGDEDPAWFNPSNLDCDQWARVCKEAGMTGIILTAKHHDGFCLWPSAYTNHSVANSPWKNGEGDVVRELAEACKAHGLKLGIYLSPWDRNHPDYGKPAYLTYFRNQLRELLTDYGDVFEVWFDGANGGTGYYGGANEERRVDKETYYDWENTYALIRELQPNAVIFSDAGPDVRWVGNEEGHAFRTMWSNLMRDSVYPGMIEYAEKYASGQENGTHWVPGETNVSIRPGWYYHEYEDHKVRSLPELLDMYYESIGRNTTWLLNFPVDKSGQIHEADVAQLERLTAKLKADFAKELSKGSKARASNERGMGFEAKHILDDDLTSYWATDDSILQASVIVDFEKSILFNRIVLQEYIPLGQRVKSFTVEALTDDGWKKIAEETTIGYKRILRLPDTKAIAVKLNILTAKACPTISNLELYFAPKLLLPPQITRNKIAEVTIATTEENLAIYYTLDGSTPTDTSASYTEPFLLKGPAQIQAIAIDTTYGERKPRASEVSRVDLDVDHISWRVLGAPQEARKLIDEDESTWWASEKGEFIVDLGKPLPIQGFTYLPMQDRWISGLIGTYELYTSQDNRNWNLAATGEFANIQNSPIWQRVTFATQTARYIKLKAIKTIDNQPAAVAELGVITQ